ncbi:hypothetical protein [Tautonia rosea]|uniref:hypothetical protein n=1 Tax=Tautonia rosea TaxID=2728037 RepID=UPI0014744FCC|nr:hypothetical protein [Tautonia rosea]
MRKHDAARRHRRAVVIIAAMAGVLLVLLASVVPWAKTQYDAKGIEPSPAVDAIFRISAMVTDQLTLVLLLVAVLIGLLWSSFGLLDRAFRSRA